MRKHVPPRRSLGKRIKVGQREHGERAADGQHDADRERAAFGRPRHSNLLDTTEAVTSAVILAG